MKTNFFTDDGLLTEHCTNWEGEVKRCPDFFGWSEAETPALLTDVIQQAPFTSSTLAPLLRTTAAFVAKSCVADSSNPCKPSIFLTDFDDVEDLSVYVGALNSLNAVLALDMPSEANKAVKGGDATKNNGDAKESKDDKKSMASGVSGGTSTWALVLIAVAGVISM